MTPLHALLQQAIEDERRATGRSKADIARAAGVHPTTLSQRREPDPATLAAVLDHLGRDVVLTAAPIRDEPRRHVGSLDPMKLRPASWLVEKLRGSEEAADEEDLPDHANSGPSFSTGSG